MSLEILGNAFYLWVSQYLAVFCLLTIFVWAGGAYLFLSRWEQMVRDCAMYLCSIGGSAVVLALGRQTAVEKFDNPLIASVLWFCFAVLLIMELLWLSYLLAQFCRVLRRIGQRPLTVARKKL